MLAKQGRGLGIPTGQKEGCLMIMRQPVVQFVEAFPKLRNNPGLQAQVFFKKLQDAAVLIRPAAGFGK